MYELVTTVILSQNIEYKIYGIKYGEIVFESITIDKKRMNDFISLCNSLKLSPVHLEEVIDDFHMDYTLL